MNYYKHDIQEFKREAGSMTDTQQMTYLRLIWLHYETEDGLENEPNTLAIKVGSDAYTVALLLQVFFRVEGNKWVKESIKKEIEKAKKLGENQAKRAEKRWIEGASKHALKDNVLAKNHADGIPTAYRRHIVLKDNENDENYTDGIPTAQKTIPKNEPRALDIYNIYNNNIKENKENILKEKKKKTLDLSPELANLYDLFRKRHTTPLDASEKRAYKTAQGIVGSLTDEDWEALKSYYASDCQYKRRNLATLLNNINGELEKARRWSEGNSDNNQFKALF